MDFEGGFPRNREGHEYLFVVVERFSKMCILIPCKNINKGKKVGNIFFEKIWVHFWTPK